MTETRRVTHLKPLSGTGREVILEEGCHLSWWKRHGLKLFGAFLIGLTGWVAHSLWSNAQEKKAMAASELYYPVLKTVMEEWQKPGAHALSETAKKDLTSLHQVMQKSYGSTLYAGLTNLLMARAEPEQAALHLDRILKNQAYQALFPLARLRLAEVHLDSKELEKALDLLQKTKWPRTYGRLAEELIGDIQWAKGDYGAARNAYLKAKNLYKGARLSEWLEMKLRDLNTQEDVPGA